MRGVLIFSAILLLCGCDEDAPLSNKESIRLMQSCVDQHMGIKLQFSFGGKLNGVMCRALTSEELRMGENQ